MFAWPWFALSAVFLLSIIWQRKIQFGLVREIESKCRDIKELEDDLAVAVHASDAALKSLSVAVERLARIKSFSE